MQHAATRVIFQVTRRFVVTICREFAYWLR